MAHFHSPTFAYNNELLSTLVAHWDDVLGRSKAFELRGGGFERTSEASDGSDAADHLDGGPKRETAQSTAPASTARPLAASAPPCSTVLVTPPFDVMPNFAPLDHLLDVPSPEVKMDHAWWENEDVCEDINPLAAIYLWYDFTSRNVNLAAPLSVIWPSEKFLQLWEGCNEQLEEVTEAEGTQVGLLFRGGIRESAKAVDVIIRAAMYPLFPKFHRPENPADPASIYKLFQD
ncbi:hypothetical protein BKA70DRAFT_1428229 [Coprinopsis sp. MPI-PUGE-AT-0042]|nr:hypothetical protein BKA70DRAFT_1428229 [Coprinopsis sp. MPI-PUGE-AT-0042]